MSDRYSLLNNSSMIKNLDEIFYSDLYDDILLRIWSHVSYYSINDIITREQILMLLDKAEMPLTVCQMSWVETILHEPYLEDGIHIIYKYPCLGHIIKINYNRYTYPAKSVNIMYRGLEFTQSRFIFKDFPEYKDSQIPTLKDRVCLSIEDDITFEDWFQQNKTPELESICATVMRNVNNLTKNNENLSLIISTLEKIKCDPVTINNLFGYRLSMFLFDLTREVLIGKSNIDTYLFYKLLKLTDEQGYITAIIDTNPKYLPIAFIRNSFDYLLPYPKNSYPNREQRIIDIKSMLSDIDSYIIKLIKFNQKLLSQYQKSFSYNVTKNIDYELLAYPVGELLFFEEDGVIKILTRKDKTFDFRNSIELEKNDIIYKDIVSSDELCNVKKLLDVFISKEHVTKNFQLLESILFGKK